MQDQQAAQASSSLSTSQEAMAGKEFLVKLDDAEDRIRAKVRTTEEFLKETHSEELHGRLRAAIGKGNLLIAQKCTQFRGLCEKNLREPAPGEFPTTAADLEGFWDMIVIQIDQVLDTFAEIEAMRANGWKEVTKTDSPARGTPTKKKLPNPLKPRNGGGAGDKQREEARKRLMEAKRAAKERSTEGQSGLIM